MYGSFAAVYDTFMDDIPYDEWAEYLRTLLYGNGVEQGLVLELGCGTGKMTRRLRDYGYDMIGIDASEEMLELAVAKEQPQDKTILYLNQDMREFELYGTVAAVVSVCDSINYIIEAEELCRVFRLVNNYLDKSGILVFDLKTEYYFREILGEKTFADQREHCSLIWENYFDEEEKINEYSLTLFTESSKGLYERSEETHYQKAYSLDEIKQLLTVAGMEFITAYDAFTNAAPRENSERIYILARERHQNGKLYSDEGTANE